MIVHTNKFDEMIERGAWLHNNNIAFVYNVVDPEYDSYYYVREYIFKYEADKLAFILKFNPIILEY